MTSDDRVDGPWFDFPAKTSADSLPSDVRTAGHQQFAKRGWIMTSDNRVDGPLVLLSSSPRGNQ